MHDVRGERLENGRTTGPETPCARCGRHHPRAEMIAWSQEERRRVFVGGSSNAARKGDGPAHPFAYAYETCHYVVCLDCYAKLLGGASVHELTSRRNTIAMVAVVVLGLAAAVATPFVLPTVLSAFWLN